MPDKNDLKNTPGTFEYWLHREDYGDPEQLRKCWEAAQSNLVQASLLPCNGSGCHADKEKILGVLICRDHFKYKITKALLSESQAVKAFENLIQEATLRVGIDIEGLTTVGCLDHLERGYKNETNKIDKNNSQHHPEDSRTG